MRFVQKLVVGSRAVVRVTLLAGRRHDSVLGLWRSGSASGAMRTMPLDRPRIREGVDTVPLILPGVQNYLDRRVRYKGELRCLD